MENQREIFRPLLITGESPVVVGDDVEEIHIDVQARDGEVGTFSFINDNGEEVTVSRKWQRVESDKKNYNKFVEKNDKSDEEKLTVYHHKNKLISPGNFLESDIRTTEHGKKLATFAAILAGAVATGAAAYIVAKRRKSS